MLELPALLAGVLGGISCGLVPGLHVNNMLPFLILLPFSDSVMIFFVMAFSIAYVIASVFPATLLGVPSQDTALMVLPAHRMVLEGNAHPALLLALHGAGAALFMSCFFVLPLVVFLPELYPMVQVLLPFLLAFLLTLLILTDKPAALVVAVLSSMLGFLTFDLGALLPLLSGFFGLSTLIISLGSSQKLPPQVINNRQPLGRFKLLRASAAACFLSSMFGFIPAVSSAIVAFVAGSLGKMSQREFIATTAATNMAYMVYSFFAVLLIGKARSGSAVSVSQLVSSEGVLYVLGIVLLSGSIALFACLRLAPRIVRAYQKVDGRMATLAAVFAIVLINAALGGFLGLLVLFTSTSIGLLANFLKVRRTACMSALITPAIFALL